MSKLLLILLASSSPFLLHADDEALTRRIYAHLTIKDEQSALAEAERALMLYPASRNVREAYIKVLAKSGQEEAMLQEWQKYRSLFKDDEGNRDIIEAMAWGVIGKAQNSPSPIIRIFSLLAAFFANDAKSLPVICQGLNDPNAIVRQVSVEVASGMRDAKLCDKMLELLDQEKDWSVRVSVIEALGSMKIEDAEKKLISIVANPSSTLEEKASATKALLMLLEDVDRKEIEKLSSSDRADLRLLSMMLVGHLMKASDLDLAIKLLHDPQAEVRKSALLAIGSLRASSFKGIPIENWVSHLQYDNDSETAIMAAWVVVLNNPPRAKEVFKRWIGHEKRSTRILAAAALAATGKYGFPYTLEAFENSSDLYVKMNLAMALITQRIHPELGLNTLYDGISGLKERWMLKAFGSFEALAPSDVKHKEAIPHYPEVVNQLTRLEILSVLAIMRHPQASSAVENFLKERSWGITGLSAGLLLTEGNEAALDIVRSLLRDSSPKVQVQAALVLALWGGDEEAIATLQSSYPQASRELKEQILEGLGRIGDPKVIPFLIDKLQESFQSLRIIAASAILECLYH